MKTKNTENGSKQAIIWGRFSSDRQADGDSKERQERTNRACAKRHSIQVIKEHFDEGISVKDGATPLFREIIKTLPSGVGIICEDLDRISRGHPWRSKAFIADILEAGHFILTSKDDREYNQENIENLDTLVMGDMASNLARYENNKRTMRVRAGVNANIELARQGKPSPLGGYLPSWIRFDFETRQYILDNVKAAVVKRIFTLYSKGTGVVAITKTLNQESIPAPYMNKTNGWTRSTVFTYLRYEGVIGTLTIKGERMPNAFPAILPETLFYSVQAQLETNKQRHGNYASDHVNNLFRGIAVCPHCGRGINVKRFKSQSKKETRVLSYYSCSGNPIGKCSITNFVRSEEIEYEFLKWFVPHSREALLGNGKEPSELDTLQTKLDLCNKHIDETMTLWDKGMKLAQVETRLFQLQEEKETIENDIAADKSKNQATANLPGVYAELDTLIDKGMEDNETRKKIAAIIPSIVKQVSIDIKDKEQPAIAATLHDGQVLKWEYEPDIFGNDIIGYDKDGHYVLGPDIPMEGSFKRKA